MKARNVLLAATLSLTLIGLASCGKENQESSQLVPIVDNYTKETTTYSDKAPETTSKIRFHYHRKGDDGSLSDYVKWSIWVWDSGNGGNGDRYQFKTYDDFGVICDVDLASVYASGFTSTKHNRVTVCFRNSKHILNTEFIYRPFYLRPYRILDCITYFTETTGMNCRIVYYK